jgi:YHS domain-containing protein
MSSLTQNTLAIDPVTRKDVATDRALTSIYQGRIYYFETAESRQRFEASPEQYAREGLGQPLSSPQGASPQEGPYEPRPRRRGGGC